MTYPRRFEIPRTLVLLLLLPLLVVACGERSGADAAAPAPAPAKADAAPGDGPPPAAAPAASAPAPADLGTAAHRDAVQSSAFCADCHPVIYAEHRENTHGRAFIDPEARIATRNMQRDDCVRCHTPRPVFETGLGMTPIRRYHDLDEGNTCMTCHWKPGYDYSRFVGGPECRKAFDPRAGDVQSCVTCHRVAGTPQQWSLAANGKEKGRTCMTCHMPTVVRPVARGEAPRVVRSHLFPAADNEEQLRRAYTYDVQIEGNEVVVSITNSGAGHNFNTANAQRSVQSLVIVRDAKGGELYRSRMKFGHGVAHPGLIENRVLKLPSNSQIPSGATREHRVPLRVAAGRVECRLYFKRYHPAADTEPGTSVLLEDRTLVFRDVAPSEAAVPAEAPAPPTANPPPPATPEEAADVNGIVKFAYPEPGTKEARIPAGDSEADIAQLVALFEYPVPYAKKAAVERLVEIGPKAVPALIRALGFWDNESFVRAMEALEAIGDPAVPALVDALDSDELYVRHHARRVLADLWFPAERDAVRKELLAALRMPNAVDRWSAAVALGVFGDPSVAPALEDRLDDPDWDAAAAAATSLAELGVEDAVPAIRDALRRAPWIETRRDLASALLSLGSPEGVPALIEGLRHEDPLIRDTCFEALFDHTGLWGGYDPRGDELVRRRGIRKIEDEWAREGGPDHLRRPRTPDAATAARATKLVDRLGGGSDTAPAGDDEAIREELLRLGDLALPALRRGLSGFPAGFPVKRALLAEILGELRDRDAAPALAFTLDDPYLSVAAWACWALERAGRPDAIPTLKRYEDRVRDLEARGAVPAADRPADRLLAQAARTRLVLGDGTAKDLLVGFLLSDDVGARRIAIDGLEKVTGHRRGFDPEAPEKDRLAAYEVWQKAE